MLEANLREAAQAPASGIERRKSPKQVTQQVLPKVVAIMGWQTQRAAEIRGRTFSQTVDGSEIGE